MKSAIALLRRCPFITFLVLTILISWFPWYIGQGGFFVFGPSIAGVLMTAILLGKEGLRDLIKRAIHGKTSIVWWAAALLLPCLVTLISILINVLSGQGIPEFTFFRQEWYLAPVFFLITLVGGPLGEEFGWRGFALPYLQSKRGPLLASLAIGFVWGLWHLPQFFSPGTFHYILGFGLLPLYVLGQITLSIVMTWIYNKTKNSLLLAGFLFHNADNFWGVTLTTQVTLTTALQGGTAPIDLRLWILSIGVYVLLAGLLLVITKGKLGYTENKKAISQE